MKLKFFAAALLSASALAPATAAVLYDNIPGFPASQPSVNGYCSPCGNSFQVFQHFTLATNATVGHADFAVTSGFATPSVSVSFWNQALDTKLSAETFLVGNFTRDDATFAAFRVSILGVDLTGVALTAGDYFVSFTGAADTILAIPGYQFGQQTYVQSFGFNDANPGGNLDSYPDNQHGAFVLSTGAVPEPASWALMISGFGLVGGALRTRRSSTTVTA